MEIVVHRGAFAQELRIDTYPELDTRALSGTRLERRNDHRAHGAGQHRAANDHCRCTLMMAYRLADLFADTAYIFEIYIAVCATGRSYANQDEVAPLHRVDNVRGRREIARCNLALDDATDVFLDDGGLAGVDEVHFPRLWIYTQNFVTLL